MLCVNFVKKRKKNLNLIKIKVIFEINAAGRYCDLCEQWHNHRCELFEKQLEFDDFAKDTFRCKQCMEAEIND